MCLPSNGWPGTCWGWTHSGFSVDLTVKIPASSSKARGPRAIYSPSARGTWSRTPHLARLAPEGWQKDHQGQPALHLGTLSQNTMDQSVSTKEARSAWARLLAKIYEVDPLRCNRCASQMRVLAVITDPSRSSGSSATLSRQAQPPRDSTQLP